MVAWNTTLTAEHAGQRVDRLLVTFHPHLGRAGAAALCLAGQVRLDGRRVGKAVVGVAGAVLSLELPPTGAQPEPEAALVQLHVDPWLVIVHKPAGQASHPLRPGEGGSLAAALLARYPEMADIGYGPREAGLLHRLDTGTSGLLLAARDRETFQRLRAALVARKIRKHYLALCAGEPLMLGPLTGWLVAHGPRVHLYDHPKPGARSVELDVLGATPRGPWQEVEVQAAHAGRHQVRVQLAAAGAPLVGDERYGGPALPGLTHHCLHASRLIFEHPVTGQPIDVSAPPSWPVIVALPDRSAPLPPAP